MKNKIEKNTYKFVQQHKDKDGITRKYKRYVITEKQLLPDEIEQLEKILVFFPHVFLRDWREIFTAFNPEGYRPDLLALAANAFDSNQNNMLGIAAEYGYDVHVLEKLIALGADINAPDLRGKAPIYWGIDNKVSFRKKESYSAVSVVQYLLNHGADKAVLYRDITPYEYAKSKGYTAAAQLIQRHTGILQSSLQSKIILGFSDTPPLPRTREEKETLEQPDLTFFNAFDASYIEKAQLTLPSLQSALLTGFKGHVYLTPADILDIQSMDAFIHAQNKIAYTDNAELISAMSEEHLRHLISKHRHFNAFLASAYIEKETFVLLLEKLGYTYLKKILDFSNKHFSWHWFLANIPSQFISTFFLSTKDLFINEITDCEHLGAILGFLNEEEQALLYEKIGSRLSQIVDDLFDLRDIASQFYPRLFQNLGHKYLANKIRGSYDLFKILTVLAEQEKLSFLEDIGFDKLRSYVHKEEHVQKLFKKMPPATHDLLKKHLFLYETKVQNNGSQKKSNESQSPKSQELDLRDSQTDYKSISKPYTTPEGKVIGIANHKTKWIRELVIYNPLSDKMEGCLEDIGIDHFELVDKKKQIFLVHKSRTNAWYQFKWEGDRLIQQHTAYAKWNSDFDGECVNDMIPLADGKWMILNQEDNNVINTYKGWSIDIYDPDIGKFSRKLNVHRDQYEYMTRITLLPDGKTVLAWDTSTVKAKDENCCSTGYNICLIDITDFTVQAITLPINPKEISGKVTHVAVEGEYVELEITSKGNAYFDSSKFKQYFSFECKKIVDLALDTRSLPAKNASAYQPLMSIIELNHSLPTSAFDLDTTEHDGDDSTYDNAARIN